MEIRTAETRVLIVSVGSYPARLPSDKQFINDLIKNLPSDIVPALWSMIETIPRTTTVTYGKRKVPFTSICRFGHKQWSSGDERLVVLRRSKLRGLLEIVLTVIIASRRSLREAVKAHNAHILHFADDIGPAIPIVKRIFPFLKITCAKPSTRIVVGTANSPYGIRLRIGLSYEDILIYFTET